MVTHSVRDKPAKGFGQGDIDTVFAGYADSLDRAIGRPVEHVRADHTTRMVHAGSSEDDVNVPRYIEGLCERFGNGNAIYQY